MRLSAPINNKDRTNFNIQYQDRDSKSRQLFGFTDTSNGYGLSAAAGWSHSFEPRFNNTANLTFSRNITTQHVRFSPTPTNIAGELGITGTEQDPINYGPPEPLVHQFLEPERRRGRRYRATRPRISPTTSLT